jgi:hypothetical protein
MPVVCGECDHFFDPSDKRSFVPNPPDPRYPQLCPACTIQTLHGREAWAVWNDCNGVFEVHLDREDAVGKLPEYPAGAECKVIPVRVYEESEDRWGLREWVYANEHPAEPSPQC